MDGGVDIVEHRQPELLAMALGDVAVLVLVCLHVTEDPGDAASGLGILSPARKEMPAPKAEM